MSHVIRCRPRNVVSLSDCRAAVVIAPRTLIISPATGGPRGCNSGGTAGFIRTLLLSQKEFREPMPSSYETTRRVEFCETDMAGIVHFANFYIWMEQAEHDFFRSLGLTIVKQHSDGTTVGWPRVSASCRFEAPARYEDLLKIVLTVQRIGVKSLTYDVRFSIDGRPVASGTIKTVCCLVKPGSPLTSIPIPDEYLSKISEFSDPAP